MYKIHRFHQGWTLSQVMSSKVMSSSYVIKLCHQVMSSKVMSSSYVIKSYVIKSYVIKLCHQKLCHQVMSSKVMSSKVMSSKVMSSSYVIKLCHQKLCHQVMSSKVMSSSYVIKSYVIKMFSKGAVIPTRLYVVGGGGVRCRGGGYGSVTNECSFSALQQIDSPHRRSMNPYRECNLTFLHFEKEVLSSVTFDVFVSKWYTKH